MLHINIETVLLLMRMNREGNNLGDKHPKSKNMLPCFFTIC